MFTIKATYGGQTRKVTFPDHNSFPSYFEIATQVYRLFPVSHGFALSKLLFSPDATFSSHNILISREVRYADDYVKGIQQFKDLTWSNALLKFTIVDIGSAPRMWSLDSRSAQEHSTAPSGESGTTLFPPSPLHAMEVDQSPTGTTSVQQHSEIPLQHKSSMTSFSSCCSVAESRAEIRTMLDDFQVGLNRVLSSNLQEPLVVSPANTRDSSCKGTESGSTSEKFSKRCSHCNKYIASSGNEPYCMDCGFVCTHCYFKITCPKEVNPNIDKLVKRPFPIRPLPLHPQRARPASFVPSTNSIPPRHRSPLLMSDFYSPVVPPTNSMPPEHRSPVQMPDFSRPVVHSGIICDACNMTIHGVRHKCLDCRDYDLCTRCITTGFAERHNPFHEFYEIREPGRVVVHTVVSGEQQRAVPAPDNTPVVHTANCDLCDSVITGDRYKCAVCPDFDTCSSCFTITNDQHPNHSFVKITKREDIIRRNVEQHVLHSAVCDACSQTIYGNRFKCMHPSCPDYDLCQNCEALPIAVHPTNHPMLKVKTPYTTIPIVRRHGQDSQASGSVTPRSFTGSRTDDNIHGTALPEASVTRAATPTIASAGLETSVPMKESNDWLSSNNRSNSSFIPTTSRASFMDPFADIFSVGPRPVPDGVGMVNPRPTSDDSKHGEFLRLIAELAGNTSPQCPSKSEDDVPKEDVFGSEHPFNVVPGALPGAVYDEPPATVRPITVVPESVDTESEPQPLETVLPECKPNAEVSAVLARIVSELPSLVPPPLSPSAESRITAPRISLSAAFVEDVSVPDGQIFPPGAEFIKSWRLINDSGCEWPESTELVFVAGDSLSASVSTIPVGKIVPGETTDVSTGELKAPEVAGRYVGYWRLRADGELFGNSLWIDINVVEADSSEESMAASSVIMPAASSAPHSERVSSVIATTLSTQTNSIVSETEDNLSDAGSDMSLISMPSSPSDDEVWHSAPSNLSKEPATAPESSAASTPAAVGMDYVLLYDDESSDEERK